MPKTIKTNRFWVGLAIFFALAMAASAVVLASLWGKLAEYEANTPTAAVERCIGLIRAGKFAEIPLKTDFTPSPFETEEDMLQMLRAQLADFPEDVTFHKQQADDEGLYLVKSGEKSLVTLAVSKTPAHESSYQYLAEIVVGGSLDVSFSAPSFLKIFANGTALTGENCEISQPTVFPSFENIQENPLAPTQTTYHLTGLLRTPDISALLPDGSAAVVQQDEKGGIIVLTPVGEDKLAQLKQIAEQTAKVYARFITRDAEFTDLAGHLFAGTPFYESMRTFYNGWYIDHESFSFENLAFGDFSYASENAFTGNISFDYIIKQGRKVHTFPSSYQLSFLFADGKWQAVDIKTQ